MASLSSLIFGTPNGDGDNNAEHQDGEKNSESENEEDMTKQDKKKDTKKMHKKKKKNKKTTKMKEKQVTNDEQNHASDCANLFASSKAEHWKQASEKRQQQIKKQYNHENFDDANEENDSAATTDITNNEKKGKKKKRSINDVGDGDTVSSNLDTKSKNRRKRLKKITTSDDIPEAHDHVGAIDDDTMTDDESEVKEYFNHNDLIQMITRPIPRLLESTKAQNNLDDDDDEDGTKTRCQGSEKEEDEDDDEEDIKETNQGIIRLFVGQCQSIFQSEGVLIVTPSKNASNDGSDNDENDADGNGIEEERNIGQVDDEDSERCHVFPPTLLDDLQDHAETIEQTVCQRLDEIYNGDGDAKVDNAKNETKNSWRWKSTPAENNENDDNRNDSNKKKSKKKKNKKQEKKDKRDLHRLTSHFDNVDISSATATITNNTTTATTTRTTTLTRAATTFSYREVASRCFGRLDIRLSYFKNKNIKYNNDSTISTGTNGNNGGRNDHDKNKITSNPSPCEAHELVRNTYLWPILQSLLGPSATLVYTGLILSFPQSSGQPWHQDGTTLFEPNEQVLFASTSTSSSSSSTRSMSSSFSVADISLPPYAINVFIPLTDISKELGPTEFYLGSHRQDPSFLLTESNHPGTDTSSQTDDTNYSTASPSRASGHHHHHHSNSKIRTKQQKQQQEQQQRRMISPLLSRGSALLYDYRVCHRGTSNCSKTMTRPMLYLLYARPWFNEHLNFGTQSLFCSAGEKQNK